MSYRSILVNLDIDGPMEPVVKAAADLAGRFKAKVIGFCAADAPIVMAGPAAADLAARAWMQMRDDIQARFKELHREFARLTGHGVVTEWRCALDNPTRALAQAARTADLVVMSAVEGAATGTTHRQADPGSVALQAGRPVLVVAQGAEQVRAKTVAVAWKDTREARRAVADSLPLLKAAETVIVLTVATEVDEVLREGQADLLSFLAAHGVEARPELIAAADEHIELFDALDRCGADLVVSGAYGHSRLREWVFGGVTRSLLDETARNRFMAS